MENAQLVALSRQQTLQRQLDIVANNVANASTTGFKARGAKFAEYLMPTARFDAGSGESRKVSYVTEANSDLDFSEGAIEHTGSALDIALRGNLLLTVNTPAGTRYTRNGSLGLNAKQQLVTSDGYVVMGEGGPIQPDPADGPVEITADGTVGNRSGQIAKLKLVDVSDPRVLKNDGRNLYSSEKALTPAINPRIDVGALEKSNVTPVLEMSRLIDISRAYSNLAMMMQHLDDLKKNALDRLSTVPA